MGAPPRPLIVLPSQTAPQPVWEASIESRVRLQGRLSLADRLPILQKGARRWIGKLEESTASNVLALGDVKVLLMHLIGSDKTIAVFTKADLAGVVTGHDADSVPIDGLRVCLWNALRGEYPDHVDSSVLEGLKLTKTKDPMTFLHRMERKWAAEMGHPLIEGDITTIMFKALVKSSLPPTVQTYINKIVSWAKMPWDICRDHIVHYVKMEQEKKADNQATTPSDAKTNGRPVA